MQKRSGKLPFQKLFDMLSFTDTARNCLSCDKPLKGRIDKKFCDDYCRSHYNNRLLTSDYSRIRNINNILRRNRRILQQFYIDAGRPSRVSQNTLTELGFNFRYCTHTETSKNKPTYHFCYDLGYSLQDNGQVLIRKIE